MKKILFYRANEVPYGVFSNFDRRHPIRILGQDWPSTEHFFQAMKFWATDRKYCEEIRLAKTPRDAATMGRNRSHPIHPAWEYMKYDIMWQAVYEKFNAYPELKQLLLSTGDAEIIEHTTNDSEWADGGDGSGKNLLGKIIMDIRAKYQYDINFQASCKHISIVEIWEDEEIIYKCEICGKIVASEENTK